MVLGNLKSLKEDMADKSWTICSFLFHYKRTEYIVLVKRFVGTERRVNNYALVKLHFMKSDDLQDDLEIEANSRELIVDAKTLRHYFGIEYQENLGDILHQFTESLGSVIPSSVPDNISTAEKSAMVQSLSKSDSEDPNKIYCTKVRRNPNSGQRSEFNSDKTKLLRPELFEHFRNNTEISFCYSDDESKKNNDAVILRNFASNNAT
ncbi:DUF6037 family protein [Lachnospiraceae bacterium ZAX-1]